MRNLLMELAQHEQQGDGDSEMGLLSNLSSKKQV